MNDYNELVQFTLDIHDPLFQKKVTYENARANVFCNHCKTVEEVIIPTKNSINVLLKEFRRLKVPKWKSENDDSLLIKSIKDMEKIKWDLSIITVVGEYHLTQFNDSENILGVDMSNAVLFAVNKFVKKELFKDRLDKLKNENKPRTLLDIINE